MPDKASDLLVAVAAVFVFAEVVAQFPVVVVACWKYAAAVFAQSTAPERNSVQISM